MALTDYHDLPISFRRFLAASLRLIQVEQLPPVARVWPDYFDNTQGIGGVERPKFYRHKPSGILLPFKGRPEPIDIREKIGIEAHITAVAFGTSRWRRAFWRRAIRDGLIPDEVLEHFGWSELELEEVVARMALHERFWKVPYHYIALLNGDVLENNGIERYTYHGNGGNRLLVGLSLEGHYPGLEANRRARHNGYDEHTILTSRAAMRLAVGKSRDRGAPIRLLFAHRQYSAGRLGDPGEGWWHEIGIPMSKELGLERRVAFKHGTGTPICREWDALGVVDYKGRPLDLAA